MRQEVLMSLIKVGGAVLAGILLATSSLAQQPQPAQPESSAKIAFVYVQRALATTEEGKIKLKEIEEWAKPRQQELERLDKEINDLKGELMSRQGVANDEAAAEMNRRLVSKQRDFEDKQRIAKRDFDEKQQALLRDIGGRLQEIITKYADQNRYTAVFIFKPDDLAYLATSADITDTVIKLFNERYPVAAKAPAAPPAK
jgi:outer membrane protein